MARPRQPWSRFARRHLLPVLLAAAQVLTLVGFPTFARPSARTACGSTTCGCPADDRRAAACCCCAKPAKSFAVDEPESCCAKPAVAACCATKPAAKTCCVPKPKPDDDRPRVVWVAGMFARGCKPQHPATGLPVPEPAVPPLSSAVPMPVEPAVAAVLAADVKSLSLPAIPPDPPPRRVG